MKQGQNASKASENDTLQPGYTISELPKNLKPVLGYRFVISGDFDGDGKDEKMIEHFYSGIDNKETNKYYDSLADYDQLVNLTVAKDPISFVISENKNIDTLGIAAGGQLLGLSYLKNEGDLNGDGTDEVSYVVQWADWSNCNTWHIVTYKNNRWTELYSFDIRDWQLPDLPETFNDYGLFGLDNKIINTTNDSVNDILEKQLLDFAGLVKKVGRNKIQVIYMNEEAMEDTMVVNLSSPIK
jgi:hypothetical protein